MPERDRDGDSVGEDGDLQLLPIAVGRVELDGERDAGIGRMEAREGGLDGEQRCDDFLGLGQGSGVRGLGGLALLGFLQSEGLVGVGDAVGGAIEVETVGPGGGGRRVRAA